MKSTAMLENNNPEDKGIIVVDILYAKKPWQVLEYKVELPVGATVNDAIDASGLGVDCPSVFSSKVVAGIYGRRCALDTKLQCGDRVEVYRPLHASPMSRRKKSADAR